jgi:hypothetical protein
MNGSDFCITILFTDLLENFKRHSEFLFPNGSNDTNFSTLGLSWARQSSFKLENNDPSGFWRFLAPKCSSWIVSASLNDDWSAQNRPWVLKLVSLKPSGNKGSKYVFNIFLADLWTKRQCKTSGSVVEPNLFDLTPAPAPTFRKFPLPLRLRHRLRLWLKLFGYLFLQLIN